jgi:hypothetical protein
VKQEESTSTSELTWSSDRSACACIDEHMSQEELWFALLRSQMYPRDLKELADTLRAHSLTTPTYPHSLAGPSHALAAQLVHPIVGLIDHAIDAYYGRPKLLVREGGPKQCMDAKLPVEEQKSMAEPESHRQPEDAASLTRQRKPVFNINPVPVM